MCLIAIAWEKHPRYRLIALANRDEFYARPTRAAQWWSGGALLAGKDLQAGGTWLGVTREGRFAALTNFRQQPKNHTSNMSGDKPSRGELVHGYLTADSPQAFAASLGQRANDYAGFSLLFGGAGQGGLHYASNRGPGRNDLAPGVYGLSNALLDDPWPKVAGLSGALDALLTAPQLDTKALLQALADPARARDDALPDTGVGLAAERMLSSAFIQSDGYGTRCSTLVLIDRRGQGTFVERSFDAHGARVADKTFTWRLGSALAAAS